MSLASLAQTQSHQIQRKRLNIGDTVPSKYQLDNLVNYHSKTAKISDFRGKLLILDYWFTGCTPCITSWPKLIKLQEKFEGKIQIMLVNHMESEYTVQSFIDRWNKRNDFSFNIPSVTEDSVLFRVLPPSGYPTIIWIDETGVFRSVTDGGGLTEYNVQSLLEGDKFNLETLEWLDRRNVLDYGLPLFDDGNKGIGKNMIWYSRVSSYSDELSTQLIESADSSGYYVTSSNWSILDQIRNAYGRGSDSDLFRNPLPYNRIILKAQDSSRYLHNINGVTQHQNLYTYQLISSEPKTKNQLKKIMQEDLNRYFHLTTEWRKIKKKCLILAVKDSIINIDSLEYSKPRFRYYQQERKFTIEGMSIDYLFRFLENATNHFYSSYPLIDETGFKGELNIVFDESNVTNFDYYFPDNYRLFFEDYELLNKALEQYGLSLTLEDRNIDILVIDDSDDFQPIQRELTQEEKIANTREKDKMLVLSAASKKDWGSYKNHFIYYVNKYLMNNYSELNAHAWEFYKNKFITDEIALNEALKWAKRSIELNSYPQNNDTYAAILYKLGRKQEALAAAQKALEMYNSAGIDGSQTLQLIEKIKAL